MILEAVRESGSAELSEDLRRIVSAAGKDGGCLFLAENEPALLRFLSQHLDDSESILPISRENWRQEVDRLLSELQIQSDPDNKLSLVIVGSSGGEPVKATGPGRAGGFEKWVDGALRCQEQFELAKSQFGKRVRELLDANGAVAAKRPSVQFQTLFFHAAVGVFLAYDWEHDTFSPLQAG